MRPRYRVTTTSAAVAGLTDNQQYSFAVTAVNVSLGEYKSVTTVSGTPVPDTEGPQVTAILVDGNPMTSGITLRNDATMAVTATDPTGIGRVEFMVDSTPLATDLNGSDGYGALLHLAAISDGNHSLTVTAVDTRGNATPVTVNFSVAQAPPAQPPVIKTPANGLVTNQAAITVSGTMTSLGLVQLLVDGVESTAGTEADANGAFTIRLPLAEGENRIQAVAKNRGGSSPLSPSVVVRLDTTLPGSPTNLTATAKSQGLIRLAWQAGASASVKGYHLYRANHSFTSISEGQRVNQALIKTTTFDDLPPQDGSWFYRVAMVNGVEAESGLSSEAHAITDATPPRAVAITYSARGNVDMVSGRIGVGLVDILLTVSEPLITTPFLSLTPVNGTPTTVELTKKSATTYSGTYPITATTLSGLAYAVFSVRDLAGNRGSDIDQGGSLIQ